MKKTYIITAILLPLILTLTSCKLQREDYTEIYPENFFQSESDLRLAVNYLYYAFSTDWGREENGDTDSEGAVYTADMKGYQVFTEMTTDAMWCTWGWGWDQLHYQQWSSTITGDLETVMWMAFKRYNFISTARNVIRNIENSDVEEEVKLKYAAEAHALRGWMGLYMYDLFGTVPVASDEVLDDPETITYLPRLTEEEYDAFMEGDLLTAIENLPEVADERGRMTKGAARMILLKYYMIKGYFDKAETIARDLYAMEGSIYELYPSYNDIFTKDNKGNKEIILQIPCNNPGMPNYYTTHCVPDDYPWTDKSSNYGAYVIPWEFYDTFEAGDDRLTNIITEYTNTSGKLMQRGLGGNLIYGALPLKYGKDPEHSGEMNDIDIVVYRYSDVLLTLAECINRNNGAPTTEAIELVNRVRTRVGLPNLTATATSSYENFNDALLLERGHEFYIEGLRRQDLIRFGKYIEYANTRIMNYNATNTTTYNLVNESHNKFWIPIWFIDESKSMIKQNSGYTE